MMKLNIRHSYFVTTFFLLFMFPGQGGVSAASPEESSSENRRPHIGLVLSGGGARGLAHIGVLSALQEMRVPVDCVVGTSMGALVGGLYAAGVSPQSMQQALAETDIALLFDDTPPRTEITQIVKRDDYLPLFGFALGFNDGEITMPSGVSAGYKFELFLKELIGMGASVSGSDFDQLPTPYRAVASDLETGDMMVFSKGELPRVMRASMSLPAIVAPTEIDGRLYVDGGLVRNLPVDIGRELCGEKLIVVNLGTPPKTKDQINNSIDVAMQSISILTQQNVDASLQELKTGDVLILPDLRGFDSAGFDSQETIIDRGSQAALVNREALSQLALSEEAYNEWLVNRQSKKPPPMYVTAINAESAGVISADVILGDIHALPGEQFDISQLNGDIIDLYGRGDFSYVGYSIIPDEADDKNTSVLIRAKSKPWGPGYLKLGLGGASDFNSPTQTTLGMSYRKTWVNSLGAEWRTDAQIGYDSILRTEFIQPLQFRDGAFIAPYAGVRRTFVQFYEGENRIGQFTSQQYGGGVNIGLTGFDGEIKIGPYFSQINSEPDFGLITPLVSSEDLHQAGIALTGIYDQLDSFVFPRDGFFARTDVQAAQKQWGSDMEYTRASAVITAVFSVGKNIFSGHYEWGDELTGANNLPINEAFKLGGLKRLSGLYLDQLTGTHYDLATLSYYRQYATLPSQIGRGMYIGVSAETGRIDDEINQNPFEWIQAGSIYWGADTILGALQIGYGRASTGQHSWYLEIGPKF
jgi:NTE family protein